MCPKTDLTDATARTLAIIQCRESLASQMDELDRWEYERCYNEADALNRSGYYAQAEKDNSYTTVKHGPKWTRRVR